MKRGSWLLAFTRVFRREINGIYNNTQLVIFCFYAPALWLLVVWALLGQGVVTHVPVAFIDNDNSPLSRETARALASCRAVKLISYMEPERALADMRAGAVYGVALIPAGYAREKMSGRGSSLVLWLDENRYAAATMLRAAINSALQSLDDENTMRLALQTGAGPADARRIIAAVHSDFYSLGNMEGSFLAFLGSTLLPGLIMIGAMLTFVTAFLRELWHSSIKEWLDAAKGRVTAAVAGKLLPYYAVYSIIFIFYIALFSGEGGFNFTGSLITWIALGMGCLADFAAMAVVVAAISPTWRMALVISAGYAAPALPFTGFSMPLDSMGAGAAMFARCLPLTWYIQGQSQEWTLGASLSSMGDTFAGMTCLFILTICVGLPLLRWKCDSHIARKQRARA